MVELATAALILIGLAFLFFGATFSSYGVAALGLAVGAGAGYLLAPEIGGYVGLAGPQATIAGGAVGAILGVMLAYALLSLAVGLLAFVIGTYAGLSGLSGVLVDGGGLVEVVVAVVIGIVLALVATLLTKTMMVFITSFVGAALASQSVTREALMAAQADLTPDPLYFDLISPLFLGLFVLGVLAQFGLFRFGYVTRLLSVLPGVRPLRDRARGE